MSNITVEDIRKSQRQMLLKALDELYSTIEDENLSMLTLHLNYNPYNMGHKIEKVYHVISYEEQFPSKNTSK